MTISLITTFKKFVSDETNSNKKIQKLDNFEEFSRPSFIKNSKIKLQKLHESYLNEKKKYETFDSIYKNKMKNIESSEYFSLFDYSKNLKIENHKNLVNCLKSKKDYEEFYRILNELSMRKYSLTFEELIEL